MKEKIARINAPPYLIDRVHAKFNAENIERTGISVSKPKAVIAILERYLKTKKGE